ncbi:hypothetical protein GcC1_057034 [Golovinomyces cichoracearum]|uniref:Uncharacterized protein n=1 Tax=Golovinomyces cichoracearum TaxID=62708 RepID=A0A420IUQ7_9PEZI|nr:hypothetical protein GcC1_057034 [Golovinomyces cichoracearum]
MADPPHSTTFHPPTPHPHKNGKVPDVMKRAHSQKSTRSDLSDDFEMEKSTPMFRPAGFGSFHSMSRFEY